MNLVNEQIQSNLDGDVSEIVYAQISKTFYEHGLDLIFKISDVILDQIIENVELNIDTSNQV